MEHTLSLHWRHNGHDCVSNHQSHDCFLKRLFRRRSKKTSKLRVTGLCAGNSPGTGEFPAQMASYAVNVSIWWRHHVKHKHICNSFKTLNLENVNAFAMKTMTIAKVVDTTIMMTTTTASNPNNWITKQLLPFSQVILTHVGIIFACDDLWNLDLPGIVFVLRRVILYIQFAVILQKYN